ncbi:MAG: YceD family protein [Cyanobacteria bacterium P01_D01_bin.73]
MDAIFIPHLLKAPKHTLYWDFKQIFRDLPTLTPVRGELWVTHRGNFIEVRAKAETIVTLTCDRCLNQYNQRLELDDSEIILLDVKANLPGIPGAEKEVELEEMEESLSPQGHFEPEGWIYEQLCLALPVQQSCGDQCTGADLLNNQKSEPEPEQSDSKVDARWSALANLKEQLGNDSN